MSGQETRRHQRLGVEDSCSQKCSKEAPSALEDKDSQSQGPKVDNWVIPVILMNLKIIAGCNEMIFEDCLQPTGCRDGNLRPREE